MNYKGFSYFKHTMFKPTFNNLKKNLNLMNTSNIYRNNKALSFFNNKFNLNNILLISSSAYYIQKLSSSISGNMLLSGNSSNSEFNPFLEDKDLNELALLLTTSNLINRSIFF